MLKYFILSLYLLSLLWQTANAEESQLLPEYEDDDLEGIHEFNDTDINVVAQPRFLQVNVNGKTYTLYFLSVNWHTARQLCASQQQALATINDEKENIQVQETLLKYGFRGTNSVFWIGGSQLGHIGQWSWESTGGPFNYFNWRNGEPFNTCSWHCVEFLGDGKWNNNDCDQRRPIICENLPSC